MKSPRFACMVIYASAVFFLTSCGGGGEKTTSTDTTAATTDTTSMNPAPANTITTTPQNMMIIKHRIADFAKWKPAYDGHDSARLADGLHNYVIARGMQDSNMVLVALKADDVTKAKAFAKDPGLKAAMKKGGVTSAPSVSLVTMVFQDTATISSDIRSEATFKVKDWNAWQQAFEANDAKQERIDNGLTVRAYGHDADDDHKVTVVTAVVDSAKAYAYWKSDMLKKRREAAGVTGTTERFVFRIIQRY